MNAVNQPAEELDELDAVMLNRTLEGGWTITSVLEVTPDVPRRCRTYLASSAGGQTVFVKILDPRGLGSLEDQKRLIDEFVYEKELVKRCAERNMRRVVRALNDGELIVPGALSIRVHYLVFEWADLDIRSARLAGLPRSSPRRFKHQLHQRFQRIGRLPGGTC